MIVPNCHPAKQNATKRLNETKVGHRQRRPYLRGRTAAVRRNLQRTPIYFVRHAMDSWLPALRAPVTATNGTNLSDCVRNRTVS
jgi:hypothetical protein